MPSDRVNEYLKSVCAEVRWRQAHDAVREELAAHIEDQTEAYMRSGMERETAERKAVESMGSPAETGLRLDASYRPKPGDHADSTAYDKRRLQIYGVWKRRQLIRQIYYCRLYRLRAVCLAV